MTKKTLAIFLLCLLGLLVNQTVAAAELERVQIKSRLDPNAIEITEIDIVFVYDEQLLADFPATKSKWYSMRRTLTRRWGDAMDVVSVFIPQGFDSDTANLPERRNQAAKVFIIAQHDDGDVVPADVTNEESVTVYIDKFGIIVSRDN